MTVTITLGDLGSFIADLVSRGITFDAQPHKDELHLYVVTLTGGY